MAYRIHEVAEKGSLAFRALAPDSGAHVLISIHTGEAVIGSDGSSKTTWHRGVEPGEPVRMFVPGVPPLGDGDPVPEVLAEVYLCGVVVHGVTGLDTNSGVADVTASYTRDPRGEPARWLTLAFTCRAARGIRIGYRVTISEPV